MISDNSETFLCPYCGQENSLFIDPSGGSRQKFVVDCETCCRPIVIEIKLAGNEVRSLHISQENE